MQVTTPHPSPPFLLFPSPRWNRVPSERKGCVHSPASHVLCTLVPLNTHLHITHKDRPRLHSPQAPFAMKGRKWAREKEKERRKKKLRSRGSEKAERQKGERNHWFVKCWADCDHRTGHSGTKWETDSRDRRWGQIHQGYFIIRIIPSCAD